MDLKIIDYNIEEITTYGHHNIKALHPTTFEVTTEETLSPKGDCIIGIRADKSAGTLSKKTKDLLRNDSTLVFIVFISGNVYDLVIAKGSSKLLLSSKVSMVVRKSSFIDDRTIAVESNKAARDINREIVKRLVRGHTLKIFLIVLALDKG